MKAHFTKTQAAPLAIGRARIETWLARAAFFAVVAGAAAIVEAQPRVASDWAQAQSAALRLIAADRSPDGKVFRAGIEIRLAPNYKTYWRAPGDSGVPPTVSFAGSTNVASADLLFPMPHVFDDASGRSVGYKDHVVWPVHVTPSDPALPVTLSVKVDYGVCDKLCIPAEGKAVLTLPERGSVENETLVDASERLVPVKTSIGGGGEIKVASVGPVAMVNGHPTFPVELEGPAPVTLLAEASPSEFFLEVGPGSPAATPSATGRQRFAVTVFDPQSARNGIPCDVRLTATTDKAAIEVPVRLDGCIAAP